MTPAAIITELRRRGATVLSVGEKVRIRVADGAHVDDLLEEVAKQKSALLDLLRAEALDGDRRANKAGTPIRQEDIPAVVTRIGGAGTRLARTTSVSGWVVHEYARDEDAPAPRRESGTAAPVPTAFHASLARRGSPRGPVRKFLLIRAQCAVKGKPALRDVLAELDRHSVTLTVRNARLWASRTEPRLMDEMSFHEPALREMLPDSCSVCHGREWWISSVGGPVCLACWPRPRSGGR